MGGGPHGTPEKTAAQWPPNQSSSDPCRGDGHAHKEMFATLLCIIEKPGNIGVAKMLAGRNDLCLES